MRLHYNTVSLPLLESLRGKFWELIVEDLRITAERYKKQRNL